MKAACPTVSSPKPQLKPDLAYVYSFASPNKTNTFLKIALSLKCSALLFSILKRKAKIIFDTSTSCAQVDHLFVFFALSKAYRHMSMNEAGLNY